MKKAVLFSLFAFILSFGVILAQEESSNIQIDLSGLEQYLTPIEIKDITVNVDAGENLVSGSFILKNRSSKSLPEVGYTVRLKKAPRKVGIAEDAAGAPLFDFDKSSENFFYYQPQEERKFNFSLGYPDSIESGTYQIVINSHDKIMNFFGSTFQEIELEGKNQLIYLDPQKCAIRVHNLDFYLNEGPPVEPNSQVPVVCEITNPTSKTITLVPEIEVAELMVADFANSTYYKKDVLPSFVLQVRETKKITFTLQSPRESLTYNTVLTLLDQNKNPVSNKLSLRYVVKGEGARVAKVNFDKTYYSKGETAKVDIEYYVSSDLHWLPENTLGGRYSDPDIPPFQANIQIELIGTAGLNSAREITCGEFQKSTPEIKTALGTTEDRIEIPIARDCYNPQIKVTMGENNKNYSQYQLAFKTDVKDIPTKGLSSYLYLVFGFVILALVYLFIKTRFKTNSLSLFIVFILIGSFMLLEAKTAQASCGYNNSIVGDGVNFSVVRGMGRVSHGDCAHMVNNIMIQGVSVSGNTINGAINLASVDYASGDQNVGEHVALTYYIKDSAGNFVQSPNTESSFITIQSTEDPADGGAGTPHILPFSINVSGLSPNNYTVYLDVRPGLRHKSFNDLNPRMIDGYVANVNGSPSGNWGVRSNYYAFGVSGDWLQFLNNNKIQTFVEPFCTSMYQGFGSCPKGQLKPPCAVGRNQYCYGFNTAWYYIPPVVRSFNIGIQPPPPQLSASCSGSPTSITAGQSVTWTASASGGIGSYSYSWSGSDGLSGNSNPIAKTYNSPGSKNASVSVTSGSQTVSQSCSNSVSVSPQSLSVNLTASPSSGTAPLKGVDLTASVSGSAVGTINYTFYCNRSDSGANITSPWDAKINGAAEATKTVQDACNYQTAGSYTAKVIVERGLAPAAESRVNITVEVPPQPTLTFSANPTSIIQGQSSTLSWDSENTDSCTASNAWSDNKPLDGSESVSPSQTSTYTLSCSGPGGSVFESVTIKFTGPFCGNGICEAGESYLICPIDCKPQCSDGIDNDGDSKIDYPQDTGCSSSSDNDERKALFQEF